MSAPQVQAYTYRDGRLVSATIQTGADARPLVVIDPEDRDLATRLAFLYDSTSAREDDGESMQAALRSLVADPKPDEPRGLGAVVEDAEGECWVRSHTNHVNAPWTRPHLSGTYRYGQIAAVRVLSEGVSA